MTVAKSAVMCPQGVQLNLDQTDVRLSRLGRSYFGKPPLGTRVCIAASDEKCVSTVAGSFPRIYVLEPYSARVVVSTPALMTLMLSLSASCLHQYEHMAT